MCDDIGGWISANTAGYWGADSASNPVETSWAQQTIYGAPLPVLLATNKTMTGADIRSNLAAITCRALVIHSDADRSVPLPITGRPTARAPKLRQPDRHPRC